MTSTAFILIKHRPNKIKGKRSDNIMVRCYRFFCILLIQIWKINLNHYQYIYVVKTTDTSMFMYDFYDIILASSKLRRWLIFNHIGGDAYD